MRLLVGALLSFLLVLKCTAQNDTSALATSLPITDPLEVTIKDSTVLVVSGDTNNTVPNDPFTNAIWYEATRRAFLWTDGSFGSLITTVLDYQDLMKNVSNGTDLTPTSLQSYADSNEIAVQTACYDYNADKLYLFGSQKVYQVSNIETPEGLGQPSFNRFSFPSLVLPKVSFYLGPPVNKIFAAQYFNEVPSLPPKLFSVDLTTFEAGFTSNTTSYYNLTVTETQSFEIFPNKNILFLGAKGGYLEARSILALDTILYGMTFTNITADGSAVSVKHFAKDEERNLLYFCGEVDRGVWIVRLNTATAATLNDADIVLTNPPSPITTFTIDNTNGITCTSIVIDTIVGVGYVSLSDSSQLGYLYKFDIRYMYPLTSSPSLTVERDQSEIVSMYLDQEAGLLYTVLDYSMVTYNYPTSCPNDCTYPNGACVYSKCNCTIAWMGSDCSEEACILGCNEATGNGYCQNGKCICASDWNGTTCEQRRCPDDCLGYGTCGGKSNNYTCTCNQLRTGRNCGLLKYTSCESVSMDPNAKSLCLKFGKTCGWCNDDQMCKTGNIIGPAEGYCRVWLYDGDLEAWPIIVAALIIIFWAIMFINNAVSAIIEDCRIAHSLETKDNEGDAKAQRKAWWRDERSAKSWKLWDQIQFLSLYTITNMYFSSRFINFTSLFNWTNFCIPIPAMGDMNSYPTRRTTSIDQFSNSVGVAASDIFWVCLIWWIIALVASLLLYGALFVIVTIIMGKGEKYAQVMTHRFFHLVSRLALAGYLPLCCLAGWGIVANVNGKLVVPLLILLIIGIGLPVFNFLVVKGEKTDFLYYQTRIRYGSLYVQFKQDKAKFAFVVYLRKFVLAVCFGFLASVSDVPTDDSVNDMALTKFWIQIIIPAIFMLLYIVVLFIVKPYVDMVHSFLDGFLNLLNIVTLAVTILFKSPDTSTKDAGLFVVMIVQITGLISVIFAYLYTWLYYAGYNSVGELCSGQKREEEDDPKAESAKKPLKEDKSDEEAKSEKKPKEEGGKKKGGEKKKDDPKEIGEAELGNLEISE